MPFFLAGLHYHAPPAPSTTARARLNVLTAHSEVRVGFARRWCVVGVQHVGSVGSTCCTPSANDHPPKADTDVKCTALCPLTCVKMHQSAAPDSPCTVCSDYTPQGAQLGTYQQPWSRFAICAPTAARAVQNERVHPQPSRGRFVPASSLSPFFRPTKERFPPL